MKPFYSFLIGLLFLPLSLSAQIGGMGGPMGGATLTHSFEPANGLQVGDVVTVLIKAEIQPEFHIYSANQTEAAQINAATFDLDPESKGIELVGTLDDRGDRKTHYDDIFEYDVSEFYNEVTFVQKFKVTAPNPNFVGYLRYQICNESMCIPETYDIEETLTATEKKKVETPKEQPAPEAQKVKPAEPAEPQDEPEQATKTPPQKALTWAVKVEPQHPKKGDTLLVTYEAVLAEGYAVFSSIPPTEPANLPTTFNLNGRSQDVDILGDLSELGSTITTNIEGYIPKVQYFQDKATFTQKLLVTGDNPIVDGYLTYQLWGNGEAINQEKEIYETFGNEQAVAETPPAEVANESKEETGLGWLMLQGFLFGLASVFTPCIFPMIPLTVTFFTKQSDNRAKGVRNAIFYGLSIVTIYTGLALIISAIFGQTALQEISNSPGFNIFFFLLLFVFALSFLGMFDITLPSSWSTAASKGRSKGGVLGIFLMALALAIVSFSCTGPLVTTALGNAAQGSFFAPAMTMLAFSSALALPFVLLAIFPGWLQSMPRSGGWLNAVKVCLGLVELALALIYLSRADLVLHWGLLDREIFIGAWIVIFTILGIYLLGKLQLPHDSPVERISVPRLMLAMFSFWFVLYLVPGMWGAPLRMLGGFIPSNTKDMGVLIQQEQLSLLMQSGGAGTAVTNEICNYPNKVSEHLSKDTPLGFCAFYDLEQGLAYAKEVNKPVFLDFTGHTCANCRYLEKNMWPDADIRRLITEEYVLISLYTDDSERLPEIEKDANGKKLRTVGDKWISYELSKYNSNAQPLYVLMDHDKSLLAQPTGYNPPLDIEAYKVFFQKGLAEFKSRH